MNALENEVLQPPYHRLSSCRLEGIGPVGGPHSETRTANPMA